MKAKKQANNNKKTLTQNKSFKHGKHNSLPTGSNQNSGKSRASKPMFNPLAGP